MMEMQPKKIGEKIRQLRLRHGLTQKELAGEYMTRNMLSLIENGVSLPSLASLIYLAEKLEVPVDYFFSASEEDEGRYFKQAIIGQLRERYAAGQYRDCVLQIQKISGNAVDDELAWIAAQSYMYIAMEHAVLYELRSAVQYLRNAQETLPKTVYAGEDLKKAVLYYRELFPMLPSVTEFPERLTDVRMASVFIPAEMLLYFGALRPGSKGSYSVKEFPKDTYPAKHLQALSAMSANRADTAVRLLRELAQDSELPYFMRFRVYSDLEEIAGNAGEYRIAYMAAKKKLDLLESAKK